MGRLTQKDKCGNWSLKGLAWENLTIGASITRNTWEKLYGALCKLLDYEETGLTPEEIEERTYCVMGTPCEMQSPSPDKWIPVKKRLPTEAEYLKDHGRFILDDGNRRYQGLFDIHDKKFKFSKHIFGINYELFEDNSVIAWQPLPQAYRPESCQLEERIETNGEES